MAKIPALSLKSSFRARGIFPSLIIFIKFICKIWPYGTSILGKKGMGNSILTFFLTKFKFTFFYHFRPFIRPRMCGVRLVHILGSGALENEIIASTVDSTNTYAIGHPFWVGLLGVMVNFIYIICINKPCTHEHQNT